MKRLFCLLGLSTLLSGCITDRDLPGREVKYQASESAQASGIVTPQVARECSEKIASQLPKVKIVGAFSLAPSLSSRVPIEHTLLPSHANDDIIVLAAPSISDGMLGEIKTVAGCSYHFRDNRLVFNDVHIFGSRVDVVRTKPGAT